MSQKVTNTNNIGLDTNKHAHKRLPKIVELEAQGKTYNEIAEVMGVDRQTIYRDRQDPLYPILVNELISIYKRKITEFADSGVQYQEIEAMKEIGRADRARITRRVESQSAHLDVKVYIDESRARHRQIIEGLTPNARKEYEALLLKLEKTK